MCSSAPADATTRVGDWATTERDERGVDRRRQPAPNINRAASPARTEKLSVSVGISPSSATMSIIILRHCVIVARMQSGEEAYHVRARARAVRTRREPARPISQVLGFRSFALADTLAAMGFHGDGAGRISCVKGEACALVAGVQAT